MKKQFLLLAVLVFSTVVSWAQSSPYTGVAPDDIQDGESYYLYNVNFGKWLGDNKRNSAYGWTSHAEIDRHGRDIKFIKKDGGWQLDPKLGNNHSINSGNLYMDTGDAVTTWTISVIDGSAPNAVQIKAGGKGLAVNQWGDMDENADGGNGNNVWQIVSRTERLQYALANGTEANPVDISGIVLGGTFPVADDHRNNGTWKGDKGNNASGGDGDCHWNRVWELWGISNRDIYQDILVPNGKYRVSGKAIYVSTGGGGQSYDHYQAYINGTEPTKGYIYANDKKTPMRNGYEYVSNERKDQYNTKDLGNDVWAMDNTNQFSKHMSDSKHVPEGEGQCGNIDVEVTDGKLRVGFKVEDADGAWILINNIDLYCIGSSVVPSLLFENTPTRAAAGEVFTVNPIYENMTSDFVWNTSDASIATVDNGTVTVLGEGDVTISCYNASYPDLKASYTFYAYTTPVGYTELAYVAHAGDRRENPITTDYVAKANTDVEVKFHINSRGSWRAIFSGRGNTDSDDAGKGISLYQNGGNENFGYFVGGFIDDNMLGGNTANSTHVAKASLARLDMDGSVRTTGREEFNASVNPISMFSNPKNDHSFEGNIYYLTIREGENVVRNYIPVMKHDGTIGYVDTKTGHYATPVENYNGYTYSKMADKGYIYFPEEDHTVMEGMAKQYLPTTENISDATFTWTSSNTDVATVAADGTVTGVAKGKATITATTTADNGWTVSYEVEIIAMEATRYDANGIGYMALRGGDGYSDNETWNKTCDGDLDTKYCGPNGNAWVTIMASEPVAVKQYSFVTGGDTGNFGGKSNNDRNPKTLKLEGSNDMNTWTTIHEMNDAYYLKSLSKEEYVFEVNDATKYRFFKLTATNGRSGCVQFAEIWINEQPQTFGEPVVENATCKASGSSKITSDLGAVRTTFIPATNHHNFVDGTCSVCGQANTILAANGQDAAYTVKYKHAYKGAEWAADPENWTAVDFDDSDWSDLVMPIGSDGYDNGANNGAKYNTIWKDEYNNFWMRREFYVDDLGARDSYTLKTLHDDDFKVYINGTLVEEKGGWTDGTGWLETKIDRKLIREGKNVIAVYIQQNWGGAYCDFSLERSLINTVNAKVGEALYATFVAPCKLTVGSESGVTASVVSSIENGYAKLTEITEIPEGTTVVLQADKAATYKLDIARTAVSDPGTNLLVAADEDVTADGTQYILAKQGDEVGFAKATPESTIAAGKGYLVISAGIKAFYPFGEENATGIETIATDNNEPIYNLAGQRLQKAQKGVNIIGSKKVLK